MAFELNLMIIGIIGICLLAIAWIHETYEIIRNRKSRINPKFGTLYVIGSLALAVYAYLINDTIFMVLNSLVIIMSGISLYYSVKKDTFKADNKIDTKKRKK